MSAFMGGRQNFFKLRFPFLNSKQMSEMKDFSTWLKTEKLYPKIYHLLCSHVMVFESCPLVSGFKLLGVMIDNNNFIILH